MNEKIKPLKSTNNHVSSVLMAYFEWRKKKINEGNFYTISDDKIVKLKFDE